MTGSTPSTVVVAIDGPAGSGKSSTARGVARAAGLRYLDTGALYRAMTWWMLERGIDVEDADAVATVCHEPRIGITTSPDVVVVSVDDADVSEAIREPRVARAVSAVSRVPQVREALVERQRRIIGDGGIVVEGRDIGTVVAPHADLKVFLVASDDERARRRAGDLGRGTTGAGLEATREALARRDHLDSTRSTSPLAKADDAVEIDTTALSLVEVVDEIVQRIEGAA
jgi:cytidylate kinase